MKFWNRLHQLINALWVIRGDTIRVTLCISCNECFNIQYTEAVHLTKRIWSLIICCGSLNGCSCRVYMNGFSFFVVFVFNIYWNSQCRSLTYTSQVPTYTYHNWNPYCPCIFRWKHISQQGRHRHSSSTCQIQTVSRSICCEIQVDWRPLINKYVSSHL